MTPIHLHKLTLGQAEQPMLDALTLSVKGGESVYLLGADAPTASALVRALTGFEAPTSGKLLLGEDDLSAQTPAQRKFGLVLAAQGLWPHLSVAEHVGFGLHQQGLSQDKINERVRDALKQWKLEDEGHSAPSSLSPELQARVAIARAAVIEPRLLLLENPFAGLNASARLALASELRKYAKAKDLPVLATCDFPAEALNTADRIVLLHKGKMLQEGAPEEVYKRPISEHAARLTGALNTLEGKVERADAGTALVNTAAGEFIGITLPDQSPADGERVTLIIRPECLHIDDFRPEDNFLEGEITQSEYYGASAEHHFRSGDVCLRVIEQNSRRPHSRKLYVWVETEDIVILKQS